MIAPSTDTPRTDAHFFSTGSEMKTLEFCRSMERDLAAALACHANETSAALGHVGKLERFRDELIAMNDRLKIEREQAIAKADAATRIMNEADKKRADAEKRLESSEENVERLTDERDELRAKVRVMAAPAVQGALAKMASRTEAEVIEAMRKNLAVLDRVKNQRDNYRGALCEIMEITEKQQLPITAQIHECANEALERDVK